MFRQAVSAGGGKEGRAIAEGMIIHNPDAPPIAALCAADSRLAALIHCLGALSYQPYGDPFAFLAETIVGQMLSAKAADTIAARLRDLAGGELTPARFLARDWRELRAIGLSQRKAEAILALAAAFAEQPQLVDSWAELPDSQVLAQITALRGLGTWSAKMYLIFLLDRPDVLPFEDGAFLQAYAWLYATDQLSRADIEARAESWRPYRSLASRYLYRALDLGYTKQPVELALGK